MISDITYRRIWRKSIMRKPSLSYLYFYVFAISHSDVSACRILQSVSHTDVSAGRIPRFRNEIGSPRFHILTYSRRIRKNLLFRDNFPFHILTYSIFMQITLLWDKISTKKLLNLKLLNNSYIFEYIWLHVCIFIPCTRLLFFAIFSKPFFSKCVFFRYVSMWSCRRFKL